ncbi:MAG TPA: TonB-dependent receptor [Marinobacter sp.]|nr:TonB-dependent receptor [Marinobacter sp.]
MLAQSSDTSFSQEFHGLGGEQYELPEVLTTTRLRQSKLKVPGSTTIITGDMIRDLGIMNLVEVFRLVPGMTVAEVGSNTPVTTYHGTVHYEQRRLQIQVDGRTAYRASLSDMNWVAMPVALENIERIEVSRGPNSAAYGINAFLGSINIITRAPQDTAGVEAYAASGSRGHLRTFTSVGDSNQNASWRLSYEKRKSDGFDAQMEKGERIPFHNGFDVNNFNFDSVIKATDHHTLDVRAGILDGLDEVDRFKSGRLNDSTATNPDVLMRDYYLQVRLDTHSSDNHFYYVQASYQKQKRHQRWTISIPAADFVNYLPPGAPPFPINQGPFIADLNEDSEESRQEFEFQDTLLFNPDLKLVSGVGYRKDSVLSETYFNGNSYNYQARLFANVEYSPLQWLTLNAGGNWEKTNTTDEGYFSPRVASNFIFNNNHALRFVFSRAVRTPDAFEQDPDWSYYARNVRAPFQILEGARFQVKDLMQHPSRPSTYGQHLEEERITSREISYFGQFPMDYALLSLEVRYFNDYLRDMISGVINEDDWFIANNVALDQEGFEIESSLDFPGTKLRATYAYLDQDERYTGDPAALLPDDQQYALDLMGRLSVRHSGSISWIQELPLSLTSAASFYWADQFRRNQFQRADFRLTRRVDGPGYSYILAFTMQHYLDLSPPTSPDNIISRRNQFFVEAGIRF